MDTRLAVFLLCLSVAAASSLFPKCDNRMILRIKTYWKGAGQPTNVLRLKGVPEIFKSPDPKEYSGIRCYSPGFEFQNKNKDTTQIVEKEGVLSYKDKKIYVTFSEDGIVAFYSCSDNGPTADPKNHPNVGSIIYADDVEVKDLNHAEGLMMLYGFNLQKYSSCN